MVPEDSAVRRGSAWLVGLSQGRRQSYNWGTAPGTLSEGADVQPPTPGEEGSKMYDTGRRPSLRARILEAQRRRSVEAAASRTPRRPLSFSEQYRGTPYGMAPDLSATQAPAFSRGRLFVLVSGAALVASCAMFLVGPLA